MQSPLSARGGLTGGFGGGGCALACLLVLALVAAAPASRAQVTDEGAQAGTGEAALADQPDLRALLEKPKAEGTLGRHEARALVEPRAEAVLSSEIGGRIVDLPFDAGEAFEKGDLLVGFDCSFHRADLAAAQAELTKARRTLENKRRLAELNSIGALEVALAEADVAKAEAQLRGQRLIVERCRLEAPFDGRVVERPVNAYESVAKDRELISVIATGAPTIRLIVPSYWLSWLTPGARFRLTIDETEATYAGVVETVGARIDPVSQTIPIEGRFADGPDAGALLPGMSGTARFDPEEG